MFKYSGLSFWDDVFAWLKAASALIIIVLYLRQRPSTATTVVAALCFWLGLATVLTRTSIVTFLGPAVGLISTFMLFDIVSKHDFITFLKWIRNLLSLYYFLNLLSYIIKETGMANIPITFLGIDNRWIYYFLPWIVVSFIVAIYERGQATVGAWAVWLVCLLQLAAVWSAGAMVSILMWPLLWGCFMAKKTTGGFAIRRLGVIFIVVIALNVLITADIILPSLRWLIVDVLHKDITLAGRTYLWESVLRLLETKPMTGMGALANDSAIDFFYSSSGYVFACMVNHPHNNFLYYAFRGGFPAMILYGALCYNAIRSIDKNRDLPYARCLAAGLSCFFLAALIDTMDFSLMHMIFAISCNVSCLPVCSSTPLKRIYSNI
ncbi:MULTISPECIES: O-antigen ligase family protein [Collinsella]|uniref:O-antigen ligase family protein n=1 Tax=Collinsella ihumii TaxID=1720204 RepID=A0AAW7JPD7_9ACTN|nr:MULTISPECIES: O-antigen ligase family protein [Collinsella]MDN0069404.1 O-antigen ligase family protein [Collinsella ihumii]